MESILRYTDIQRKMDQPCQKDAQRKKPKIFENQPQGKRSLGISAQRWFETATDHMV